MTTLAEILSQPRRVRFTYPNDAKIPAGTYGVTEGLPFSETIGAERFSVIRVDFNSLGTWGVSLSDIETVED